jgi:hypothetical protein
MSARIISQKQMSGLWAEASKDRQKSEIACSFHGVAQDMMWLSKDQMGGQACLWRDQIKAGKIECRDYNNFDLEDEKTGKKWYCLVVQPTKEEDCQMDPIMMMVFGIMVDGFAYFYKTKSNRDSIYEFINKQ